MTPERWQHVKEIFHAALERAPDERTSFLDEACADDAEARREVVSLINSYEQTGEFLDAPAYAVVAESLADERELLAPGQQIGNYKVLAHLGSGGMGDVYLAEDARLGRKVALKLLPSSFTRDRDRVRRFEQEARSASALNHPNVCTIHEIGETEQGHRFIVMEYVDGPTLRAVLSRGPLSLGDALDIAAQVAAALAAAHVEGIVHRDVKPENVMVRPDGLVKVLDFGLAKLVERRGATDTEARTRELLKTSAGLVMGTVSYMSPEQARGAAVDARTDVWSLGVVLYEMVAGRAPFAGETHVDMIVSLLEREPAPLSSTREDVPAELERIVRKALRKDREERYQTIKDMALDLKSLRRELDLEVELERSAAPLSVGAARTSGKSARVEGTTAQPAAAQTDEIAARTSAAHVAVASKRRKLWLTLVAVAVAASAVLLLIVLFGGQSDHDDARLAASAFRRTRLTKITTHGSALAAAVSPDGRHVAYVQSEGERQSLWVRQVATAASAPLIPAAEVAYLGLAFSPDGEYIYYAAADAKTPPALYRVPALAQSSAPAVKVLDELYSGLSLAPDGRRVSFTRYEQTGSEVSLMVVGVDGTGERAVAVRHFPENFASSSAWSPDGKQLAVGVIKQDEAGTYYSVEVIGVEDGSARPVTNTRWNIIETVAWLPDGSGLLINARSNDESFLQLWLLPYPSGEPRKVTNDLTDYHGISVSADGRALVTLQAQSLSNVWVAPMRAPERAAPVTSGGGRYFDLSWTPDGKLLYASDASGSADIWEMNADGTGGRQITLGEQRNYGPHATADGRYIVFHSNRTGSWQVWRMNRDGSGARQLTSGGGDATFPQTTPDGRWVIYQSSGDDLFIAVWRVSIEGGTPERLTERDAMRPAISPDGRWIACWQTAGEQRGPWVVALIPIGGGPPVKTFEVAQDAANWDNKLAWTSDGKAITYFRPQGGRHNIWAQPIDGGPPRRQTNFISEQVFSHHWSQDGRLALSRGVLTGDIVLISDIR